MYVFIFIYIYSILTCFKNAHKSFFVIEMIKKYRKCPALPRADSTEQCCLVLATDKCQSLF